MEMFYHVTSIVKDESRCINLDWFGFHLDQVLLKVCRSLLLKEARILRNGYIGRLMSLNMNVIFCISFEKCRKPDSSEFDRTNGLVPLVGQKEFPKCIKPETVRSALA